MKAKFRKIEHASWDRESLKRILARCEGKRVLVVGDVGVDRYTVGAVERISPEAPVPIVLVEREELKLGLAANVSDNIHAVGGRSDLVGIVGRDRGAEDFAKLLKRAKISTSSLVTDPERRTVLKERVVSERQQLLRIDYETPHPVSDGIEKEILAKVSALLPKCDAVIVQDYAKGMISAKVARGIFGLASKARKIFTVDPNGKTPIEVYCMGGDSVLKPNLKEAEKLSGLSIKDDASLARAGFRILELVKARHVVITRGKDGMAIFTKGSPEVQLIPTYVREVYDVSGAGDTVIAVLTLALSAGARIEEACILANLAAGVEVGKRGTATVSPDEILRAMEFFGTGVV